MKNLHLFLFVILISFTTVLSKSKSDNSFLSFIDPLPGAEYINKQTTIILRSGLQLSDKSVFNPNSIKISGSIQNNYEFTITKSGNNTYILKPLNYFANGEVITVNFTERIKYSSGISIKKFSSTFKISSVELPRNPLQGLVNEVPDYVINEMLNNNDLTDENEDFPQITVTQSNNPAPGYLLLSNIVFNVQIPNTPHLLILKNDGTPFFSRQMGGQIFDFNRQPNGNFTYFSRVKGKYFEMDSTYTIIDSFYTGNGYVTDIHELRVLPNRHALLMSYDKQPVDMSLIVPGGNPNALVTGLIIQEIDENKNVVFQWRSWDHILITDATHEDLTAQMVDYIHGNALELDNDGNILLSSRHLDEITKINRFNGNTIWRLGGKHNQFTFNNDPLRFSYQHAIRRLQNGNIILFDNGNYHTPQFSRAVEYILDETNMQVTLFWEYRNIPVIYGYAMGFAQRLGNGNTLIGWGATNPTLTEVKPDGSIALGLTFSQDVFSYRAFKYEWSGGITGIQPVNNEVPTKYGLMQNYPNPFNPSTKIKFHLPVSGFTEISVYDALGRFVSSIIKSELNAGNYEIEFNSSNLPGGVYFYRLSSNDFSETKKMILVK